MIQENAVQLPESSAEFVRQILSETSVLGNVLVDLLLGQGSFWTFPVAGLKPEDFAKNLALGGITSRNQAEAAAAALIASYLDGGPDRVVLFEHPQARLGDAWLEKSPVPVIYVGHSVLPFLTEGLSRRTLPATLLRRVGAYPTLGILGRLRVQPADGANFTLQALSEMLAQVDHLIVGAFDEEGYIVWSR